MKSIAVIGSTGGMGRALCARLARDGWGLALCARNREKLDEQAKSLEEEYRASVLASAFDICDESAAAAFFADAEERFGKLHALINLAGLSIPTRLDSVTGEMLDRMIDANLKSALIAARYYAMHAVRKDGLILNLGSMAARRANGNAPLYCASKAALNMLSAGIQIQLNPQGIRVTTLNPGGTDTPFWGDRPVDRTKMLSPEDTADTILFVLNHPRMIIHSIDFESAAVIG